MQVVTVVIDEKGDSTVDLAGFNGKGCAAIQEGFACAVGKSDHVTHKPEYNRPCLTQTKLQQKG
jgi:hypothetical protein